MEILSFIAEKFIPLLLSVLGFGLLIVVHELGHLIFCKIFNIYVPSFSVGFGPKIFERKIGETTYRLAQIPFGGYVEIAGQEEIGQGDQQFAHDTSERSYASKWYWQKVLVWLGGIMFNLIFAYIVFIGLFLFSGNTHSKVLIGSVGKDSPAAIAGIKSGDEILQINDINLADMAQENPQEAQKILLETIQAHPEQNIDVTILRNEISQTVSVKLGSRELSEQKKIGVFGASFPPCIKKLPFKEAILTGVQTTNAWIGLIAMSLKNLFTQKTLAGAGGPVMIFAEGFKTAQHGVVSLLIFLAIMSINLALFNLLPLGITDGGQLLFATIECIIRRPLPNKIRIAVNVVSLGLFVLLAAYLTYKDVATLFGQNLKALWAKCMTFVR